MLFLLVLFFMAIGAVLIFAIHLLPLILIVGLVLLVFAGWHKINRYDADRYWWHRDGFWPWRRRD